MWRCRSCKACAGAHLRHSVIRLQFAHTRVISVEIAIAQENADDTRAAACKRVNFSLAEVNDLLTRLEVARALHCPPPLSPTHRVLQRSGHMQQVPASHTREKCVTLTAVSSPVLPTQQPPQQ